MPINSTSAKGLFTKTLIEVFRERPKPTAFLRSFFPSVETASKELSIEVMRGTEKVAVDVVRGSLGNRNQQTKSTEKVILPPYYREYFDLTGLHVYDRVFGSSVVDESVFVDLANATADELMALREKIERSYELQCAQALTTGIVTIANGDNIDFMRKALSLVDLGSGNYFASNVNPFTVFETGCNFLRQVGKAQGGVFNAILGTTALADLLSNTVFTGRQNLVNLVLDAVAPPQKNALGGVLHGEITCGPYRVRLWSYPEFYDNASGTSTPYIDPKKIVLLPEAPRFKTGFAAVPQLAKVGQGVIKGAYVIGEYIEEREQSHIFDVRSAGIVIPVAVDQIWTVKVVA